MLEKEIERYLCLKVKDCLGGMALKFVSPGLSGVPDRIVLLPHGKIYFVELKAPSKRPRKLQAWVQDKIKGMGFRVCNIDDKDGVDRFVRECLRNGV